MNSAMTKKKVFLDTSILIGRVTKRSKETIKVFKDPELELYTNELALKELYHVLKDEFKFSDLEISYAIDYLRAKCIILSTPPKNEMKKIKLRDKSDRPFVCSALKYNLELYIDDFKTFQDAEKYVKVRRISKK
jgi:predicted nucleic acid-binding protein